MDEVTLFRFYFIFTKHYIDLVAILVHVGKQNKATPMPFLQSENVKTYFLDYFLFIIACLMFDLLVIAL